MFDYNYVSQCRSHTTPKFNSYYWKTKPESQFAHPETGTVGDTLLKPIVDLDLTWGFVTVRVWKLGTYAAPYDRNPYGPLKYDQSAGWEIKIKNYNRAGVLQY